MILFRPRQGSNNSLFRYPALSSHGASLYMTSQCKSNLTRYAGPSGTTGACSSRVSYQHIPQLVSSCFPCSQPAG